MSPVCFLGSDDINQFNYAKCIVIINSTPKPILVTVTYKDETSKITKNSTIQAWDIHQFRGEIKTLATFSLAVPLYKVLVRQEGQNDYEYTPYVKGIHNCIEREVTVGENGLNIIGKIPTPVIIKCLTRIRHRKVKQYFLCPKISAVLHLCGWFHKMVGFIS